MIKTKTFKAKDGRTVILRSVRWDDLGDLIEFIDSLADEGTDILRTERVTREEEAEWLGRRLARIDKGELIDAVAEVDGRVVANSEVQKRTGLMSHIGDFGIGIKSGYRGIGIGTEIMKTLIEESRNTGLRILVLDHFATNKPARALYEKMGFKETGTIPKGIYRNGKYIDLIRMVREL
jgi:RimJ/RimL family protein N-acetyltransferase